MGWFCNCKRLGLGGLLMARLVLLHPGAGLLRAKGGAAGRCSGSYPGGGAAALAHFPRPAAAGAVDVDAKNREHQLVALLALGRMLRVLGAVLVVVGQLVALPGRVVGYPVAGLTQAGVGLRRPALTV